MYPAAAPAARDQRSYSPAMSVAPAGSATKWTAVGRRGQSSPPMEVVSVIAGRDRLPAGPRAQGLQYRQRDAVPQEPDRAVGEGEVGPARVAAAEDTGPVLQGGEVALRRHPVVDRR